VAPVLIETGSYQWPWLGVEGDSVDLLIMEANNLDTQQGAYIERVIPGSPADSAGLRGSSGTVEVNGLDVPQGGDVVVEADGNPITDFNDLLGEIAFRDLGSDLELMVIRNGRFRQIMVELGPRPSDFTPTNQ
jgi:serine protease Do